MENVCSIKDFSFLSSFLLCFSETYEHAVVCGFYCVRTFLITMLYCGRKELIYWFLISVKRFLGGDKIKAFRSGWDSSPSSYREFEKEFLALILHILESNWKTSSNIEGRLEIKITVGTNCNDSITFCTEQCLKRHKIIFYGAR